MFFFIVSIFSEKRHHYYMIETKEHGKVVHDTTSEGQNALKNDHQRRSGVEKSEETSSLCPK